MSLAAQLRENANPRFDYCNGVGSGGCTDIDVLYERHGHFLVIENKHPGEEISRGQLIALRALAKLPRFTVWVAIGYPPDDIRSAGLLDGEQHELDVSRLRAAIQRWWDKH